MKKLLKSDGFISAILTGFLFVQVVGVGLFAVIDEIVNYGEPTLVRWTFSVFWNDRSGAGIVFYTPVIIFMYAIIGFVIKGFLSWHSANFMRRK